MHQIELLFRSEGVGGLLRIFSEFQLGSGSDVTTAVADAEGVGACLGEPLTASLVEGGEVAYGDGHRQSLTFTGLQFARFGEGLQFLGGFL